MMEDLPILICTSNLGNARPDPASLNAFIPNDGLCHEVLRSKMSSSSSTGPDQFMLIVIGMQEATWGPSPSSMLPSALLPDAVEQQDDNIEIISNREQINASNTDDNNSNDNGLSTRSTASSSRPKSRRRHQRQGTWGAHRLHAALRSFRGLTASRDHTKRTTKQASKRRCSAPTSTEQLPPSQQQQQQASTPVEVADWDFGTAALHRMLEARLPSYTRLVSFQRGEMRLEIFVHQSLLTTATTPGSTSAVSVLQVSAQNTGRAGLANKGGIVAELLIHQTTRLAFVTCHLEAHEGRPKYEIRCNTMADIFHGTRGGGVGSGDKNTYNNESNYNTNKITNFATSIANSKLHDVSLSSHCAFVMGDLNFRTELDPSEYTTDEEHKLKVREMVRNQDWEGLNRIDELHRALRNKDCLVGFQTLPCNFPPTFKVERQAGYDYIDKRRPSYTDRILWKDFAGTGSGTAATSFVTPLSYEAVGDFTSSDHKPVRAAFSVRLQPRLKMRPRMTRVKSSRVSTSLERSFLSWGGGSGATTSQNSRSVQSSSAHSSHTLFLFVSQMRCQITDKGTPPPSPYVMLVSFPEAACQQEVRFWDRVKSFARMGHTTSITNPDGSKLRLAFGWPRSSLKRNTLTPDYDDEEIVCQLQTHTPNGGPIDLTGCMLRITLMNDNIKNDDPVIGSIQYNLAALLRKSIGPDGLAAKSTVSFPPAAAGPARSDLSAGQAGAPSPDTAEIREDSAETTLSTAPANATQSDVKVSSSSQSKGLSPRMTILQLFRNVSDRDDDNEEEDEDDDPIVFDVIDEPLLKNGRQVGTMQCKIETWWMNQQTARSLSLGVMHHRRNARQLATKKRSQAASFSSASGDGPMILLSARKTELAHPPSPTSPFRKFRKFSAGDVNSIPPPLTHMYRGQSM